MIRDWWLRLTLIPRYFLAKLLNIIKPASKIDVSDAIDQDSHQWILDTFSWALTHFDVAEFKNNSQLVLPNNQFYLLLLPIFEKLEGLLPASYL